MEQPEQTIGLKNVIKRTDFIRIIIRALHTLGFAELATLLEKQSGIGLHLPVIDLFIEQVLAGKWSQCVETLYAIGIIDKSTVISRASLLLWEQCFLEFLREDKISDALDILRNKIVPIGVNPDRVQKLANWTISPPEVLDIKSRVDILEILHKFVPPALMIHPRSLENLIEEVFDLQQETCKYHNILESEISLFSGHWYCGRNRLPSKTKQVLEEHTDQVWVLQFSHNGKYLASASRDQSAIIWQVKEEGEVSLKHILQGHQSPISTVSWSPDDKQLLTCGEGEVIRRWDTNSGECLAVWAPPDAACISCGWLYGGYNIFAVLNDQCTCLLELHGAGPLELEGQLQTYWEDDKLRVDMAVSDERIFVGALGNIILLFCNEFLVQFEEEKAIISISLSKDRKFLLVTPLANEENLELHLWDLRDQDPKIVARYRGLTSPESHGFMIPCFGGQAQSYIACGSVDSQVYIWHRSGGEPITALSGHSDVVNCVSWNPANIYMLASASDDHTIRIWGLGEGD